MTVNNTNSSVTFPGNGAAREFTTAFELNTSTELKVFLITVSTGVEVQLTTSDYSIPASTVPAVGVITYPVTGSPISATFALRIERNTNTLQSVNVTNQTGYNASVVMQVWDKIHRILQEIISSSAGTMRVTDGKTLSPLTLPSTGVGGWVIIFNAAGDGLELGADAAQFAIDAVLASDSASAAVAAAALAVGTAQQITPVSLTGAAMVSPYTLPFAPVSKNLVSVFIDGIAQSQTMFTLAGNQLTFVGGWPTTASEVEIKLYSSIAYDAEVVYEAELANVAAVKALDQGVATTDTPTFAGINTSGTVAGRDLSVDGDKLDLVEAGAQVTNTVRVAAAGAMMDSELSDIAAVKALNQGIATTDSPTFSGISYTGKPLVATMSGFLADNSVMYYELAYASLAMKVDLMVSFTGYAFTFSITGYISSSAVFNLTDEGATTGKIEFAAVPLTGTTGTDGVITVSVDDSVSPPRLYVENRLGSNRSFVMVMTGLGVVI